MAKPATPPPVAPKPSPHRCACGLMYVDSADETMPRKKICVACDGPLTCVDVVRGLWRKATP
jgi:hypothetical protein